MAGDRPRRASDTHKSRLDIKRQNGERFAIERKGRKAGLIRYLADLAKLLSGPVLRELHRTSYSKVLAETLRVARSEFALLDTSSLLDTARHVFDLLKSDYRTDYVFRAAIAKKIFLGRHSPSTTALLPELRVWRSRVDLLMLNGTSTAYEIKSGFDTTRRLGAQVADYLKMFDRVYVVTEERLVGAVSKELPDSIGIIVLTPDYTLRSVRGCVPNAERVDIAAVADALRKEELCELTRRICGRVPEAPSSRLFADCLQALRRDARPKDVHDEAVKILKRRAVLGSEAFRDVEEALVPAFIESGLHHSEWPTLTGVLRRLTVGKLSGSCNDSVLSVFPVEDL